MWSRALLLVFPATLLYGVPSLTRVPLSFEPGVRNSEFVGRAGATSFLLTPAEVRVEQGRMRLIGGRSRVLAQPEELLPGYSNYLMDSDPRKWRTHVPNYRRVRYRNVYPGIDVVYYGNARELEFDFVVAPGADPRRIQLALSSPDLNIRLPRIYQSNHAVQGRAVRRGNRITFEVSTYDHSRPLVIDPVLSYAAIFGGGGADEGRAIAVDSTGAAYVIGNAFDGNFPVVNGRSGRYSFLAKLNAAGNGLVYSTYLPSMIGGGASSYAIDASGAAYLTRDGAPDFPIIGPAPLRACANFGGPDVYVAKLSSDGASLVYAGCLGGAGPDYPRALAVDAGGNAYVTGFTQSADFPLLNAFQTTHPEGNGFLEGFVLKLKPDGMLAYSTFLGGGMGDFPNAIAVDAMGNVYITGQTSSPNFPLKNALQSQRPASPNVPAAFIAKIKADGSDLVYSTYFGGSNGTAAQVIAADGLGNAYVAGSTNSGDLPTTKNALQTKFKGAFLFKTTNGADSWAQSDSGLPGSASSVRVDPQNTSNVYAVSSDRLFKSSDGGATWKTTSAASATRVWINPGDSTLFVSGLKGEVLRSRDDGASFTTLNTGVTGSLNQLVFNPNDSSIIYGRWGGTGAGDGVYKSVDGGDTWKPTGLKGAGTGSGGLAIDPTKPSRLYASRSSNQSAGGLYQSDDSGETWTSLDNTVVSGQLLVDSNGKLYAVSNGAILVRSGDTFSKKVAPAPVGTLVIDPTNTSIWYAIVYGPSISTLYKTLDSGDTWQPVNNGFPNSFVSLAGPVPPPGSFIAGSASITSLDIDPNSPGTLYAGMVAAPDGFFSKLSADGSALLYSTYLGGNSSDSVRAMAVDATGNTYLAGDTNSPDFPLLGAFRSSGGGFVTKFDSSGALLWSSSLGGATANAIAVAPSGVYLTGGSSSADFAAPSALQPFVSGEFFRTIDAGASWTGSTLTSSTGFGSVRAVAVDPQTPSHVFALADRLYASNDSGQSWMQLGIFGFSDKLTVNPQTPAVLYASGPTGVWKSLNGGITWAQKKILRTSFDLPGIPVSAFALDPTTPATIYAGILAPASALPPDAGGVPSLFKSTDAGETWNLTGSPTYPVAVAVDPLNSAVLYGSFAVSSRTLGPTGSLSKSTDGGSTWTPINNGLPAEWLASALVADPGTPGRVYALGNFFTNDIYRTDDGGSHWSVIGAGLPAFQITSLAIDPGNSAVVYASSSGGGLYRTTDAGANWSVVPALQIPIVNSIAIDPFDSSRIYTGAQVNPQDVFVMKIVQ